MITQSAYPKKLLERVEFENCKAVATPMTTFYPFLFSFIYAGYVYTFINATSAYTVHYTCTQKTRKLFLYLRLKNIKNKNNKKLSYRRGTARCVWSVETLPIATQQCRNYLYNKS